MMTRTAILVLVTSLALGIDAIAQQQARPRAPQRVDPLTAAIRGRVTTADTGAPIRGAELRLAADGRYNRLVTTNAEGRFELRDLPAGEYTLSVSRTGFISAQYGQRRPFAAPTTIKIAEGQDVTANVTLVRGGAIYGRVLDQFGEPTAGIRVQALRSRMVQGRRRLQGVGPGDQTDDTGAFRIYGLPPGDYFVAASGGPVDSVKRDPPIYYPGTPSYVEAQPITLSVGTEATADFQMVATRNARLSGVVLNSSGAPISAMVNLSSETLGTGPENAMALHADAGPDGTFTIENVPPGPYTITAMAQFDAGMLAGRVNAGASPEALREEMAARVPETAAMPLVVGGDDQSGLTLVTRRGGRVSGRFVPDTGVVRPLPTGLRLNLRSEGPGNMSMWMGGIAGSSTEFFLAGMGGPTRFVVEGVPDQWVVKAILVDGTDVTDQAVDLSGGNIDLRVVMSDRPTSVSGTVESSGQLGGRGVIVFVDDETKWTYPTRYVKSVITDDQGRFMIRGLPAGERYFAAAFEYLEDGDEQDPQLLERVRSRATSFSLRDGEQRSIQLDIR